MLNFQKNNEIKRFENYLKTEKGEDLFEKAYKVNDVLSSGILTGNEGLGFSALEKLQGEYNIKQRNGKIYPVIMLGSNSYLNLSTNPKVINASKQSLEKYGYGMGAVSNYVGITEIHKELEKNIAKLYSAENSIVFPSGYGTNIGVISALCNVGDVIINDSANHASIFDGCKLSGAEIKIFPHSEMKALERILKNLPDEQTGRLIITDGVFSMDGDIAKLDIITELAKKYNCRVMVDDAHGLGIVGKSGKGAAEHYNILDKIDLHVGMLSKSPGGLGGYCAANNDIITFLRLYARTYFFSTGLPAPTAAGLNEVFKMFLTDNAGRQELWYKINYLKSKLIDVGFNILNSQSAIIPVMIYDEEKLFKIHSELLKMGLYTNIVTYPAVRRKECRLRLCVMKDLTFEQLDRAVKILTHVCKKYEII
jgi:glycine C-acetyltransferase